MSMHKGMCGWPNRGAASVQEDTTLADYITRKQWQYREKQTFAEWWAESSLRFSLDDADSLRVEFERCWSDAQDNT